MIEITTFLQSGEKQVVSIAVIPQYCRSYAEAKAALEYAFLYYQHCCGRTLTRLYNPVNPFVIVVLHGGID